MPNYWNFQYILLMSFAILHLNGCYYFFSKFVQGPDRKLNLVPNLAPSFKARSVESYMFFETIKKVL